MRRLGPRKDSIMINNTETVINVKRGSARKRSRDGSRSSLTPARKKTSSTVDGQSEVTAIKPEHNLEVTPDDNPLEVRSAL